VNADIRRKTIAGLLWSLTEVLSRYGISFFTQIILARVLLPSDFGLIGMISIFIAISGTLIDSGFTSALIREKETTQEDLSTIFFFNLLVAIVLYVVLFFAASPISLFFNEPKLANIVRIVSLGLIINSFGLIQRTILTKKLNFKIQTNITIFANIISGSISVLLALLGFGVWSLVLRNILTELLQSFLLCYNNRWYPSLVFSKESFKKMFSYSWKILVSGLIYTFYNNIYYLVIGKLFSSITLGYYTNARHLIEVSTQSITTSVQKVTYPVLSSIKEDPKTIRAAFIKLIQYTSYVNFIVTSFLIASADSFIPLILGNNWIHSIPYFKLLCLAGSVYPLHAINLNLLQTKGRSDLFLKIEIVKDIISVSLIALVIILNIGVIGLLWVAVISSFIAYFINSYFSQALIGYSTFKQIRDLLPSIAVSMVIGFIVYGMKLFLPINPAALFMVQLFTGFVSFIALNKLFKIKGSDMFLLLIRMIKKDASANE